MTEVIRAYQPTIPGPWFWSLAQGAPSDSQGADSNTPLPGDSAAPWQVRTGNEGRSEAPREPREQGAGDRTLGVEAAPGALTPDSPGQTDRVASALAKARMGSVIPLDQRAALGRCRECEWHMETMGHAPGCPNRETGTDR